MDDLMDRKSEDWDRLTEAVAAGYAISMSPKAAQQWQARHGAPPEMDREAAAARQSATIARLRAYGWKGANPIKGKAN